MLLLGWLILVLVSLDSDIFILFIQNARNQRMKSVFNRLYLEDFEDLEHMHHLLLVFAIY